MTGDAARSLLGWLRSVLSAGNRSQGRVCQWGRPARRQYALEVQVNTTAKAWDFKMQASTTPEPFTFFFPVLVAPSLQCCLLLPSPGRTGDIPCRLRGCVTWLKKPNQIKIKQPLPPNKKPQTKAAAAVTTTTTTQTWVGSLRVFFL